ncbi:esterase/lipase family protein [Fodinibius halophilus]|uniref:Alpha/beta hydrolase n=1 Tax=Fodinibius halophilus TaxID=1736908 RepID=A0A6M1TB68_9BACT|nr:alpha/beta fold hydrolase [Fodinibius halophilus]NGP88214.1 alpha/beta hydrolase [Fodinibius halophilus]
MIDRLDTDKWLKRFEINEFPEPESITLKHPVLLCHGYGAIASLVKPSPLYDVAMLLRTHNVPAFAPNIVPYAKIETRAEGWVQLIQELTEEVPSGKVNIIAHSMGGLDMRYALAKLDIADQVASFTTICTPHRGTSLAELTLKTPDAIRDKLADFLDWMGDRIYPKTKSDSVGSAEQLTRKYVTEVFNPQVPNVPDIPYYSYSSAVGKGTNAPIRVIARYQNKHIFDLEGINDGMVSVASSKWGEHIKTLNLSHLEQMNLRVKDDRQEIYQQFWIDIVKMLRENGH